MDIGLLFTLRNPSRWFQLYPEFYAESFRQMAEAEQLGYDTIWLSEHHFVEDGYAPSTLVNAAVIASMTSRIGTMLLLLPFHNALRLAEDVATIDIISNGRFDLGFGISRERACIPV